MGLLANVPGSGTANTPPDAAPVAAEDGPYLNEFPNSSTSVNGNPHTPPGTYTWIVLASGQVVGVAKSTVNPAWYAGFNGTYP